MWKFLLVLALASAVQGASLKNEQLLESVRALLDEIKREEGDINYDASITGEGATQVVVVDVNGQQVCYEEKPGYNAVKSLIADPKTERRPETFYFGEMGDNIHDCELACAHVPQCKAYTLYLSTFASQTWAGQCYGRSNMDTMVLESDAIMSGVKVPCGGSSSEDSSSSSSSSEEIVDSIESQDAIVEEALHWLQDVYPEVFSVYINDVEDMSLLNDAMSAIMGHFLGAEREDLTPCIQIAQLVGATQYTVAHELSPGMHLTIRQILDHVLMDYGLLIPLTEEHMQRIKFAIYEPLIEALNHLECQTGLFECPSVNSIAMATEYASKSEKLFIDMYEYLMASDMQSLSVGEILANMVGIGHSWFQEAINGDMSMVTCDASIVERAPQMIKQAIEQVLPSLEFAPLQSRVEAELHSLQISGDIIDLARELTSELLKDHFVDDYLAIQILNDVLNTAEQTQDIEHAVAAVSGYVLGFIYEEAHDLKMHDLVDKDLHAAISRDVLLLPISKITLPDSEHILEVTLKSIVQHWRTPCLNARLIGMLAGATQVFKTAAMSDPRLQHVLSTMSQSLQVSIADPEFRVAVDEIIQMTIHESFEPLVEIIHDVVGQQPTEVSFIELHMRLSSHLTSSSSVMDYVHSILDTLIPLLGHFRQEETDFVCEVRDQDMKEIVRKAYELHQSITSGSRKSALYNLVHAKLMSNFATFEEDTITSITAMAVDTLNDVIVLDALKCFERLEHIAMNIEQIAVHGDLFVPSLVDFLAHEYAIFAHALLATSSIGQPIIGGTALPPVNPTSSPWVPSNTNGPWVPPSATNPPIFGVDGRDPTTDYMVWQQRLVNDFVMHYMSGMMSYTQQKVVHDVTMNPCVRLPEMCSMLHGKLNDVMAQYEGNVKRSIVN